MTTIRKFQIDLTDDELNAIDRLGTLAGLRTKKEVILNSITLFRWAAKEIMYGRTICSVDEKTQAIRQLELPALSTISDKSPDALTSQQIQDRLSGTSRPFSEFDPTQKNPAVKGIANVTSVLGEGRGVGMGEGLGTSTEK